MPDRSQGSFKTQIFVGAIVVAGAGALASSLYTLYREPIPNEWMLLASLTLLSFFLAVKVPGAPVRISVSETFVFASVLLFGTAAATVTVALDALIMSGWQNRREPLKLLFNTAEPTLSIWLASTLFFLIVGEPLHSTPRDATSLLLPALVLSLSYLLLNTSLTAIAISLQSGDRAVAILREHFLWIALNYLGGASAALLIVQNSTTLNATAVSVILPLLVITYLTFKSSMGRIDDANKHVERLNQMHMSTIETLAMAVDAKDQTTHGHIRRVQTHAVSLAKALGIDDTSLIRAIEAAALLHDIGKLGVPEHILNKPGALNADELEQMRTHAALGADILSTTEFPYPVVPIVRHHHENWDGSGYPDGLAGVEIPIGARLLAVVDCFDALTSDRPYRQRMTRSEALDILVQRRGQMYDPLIVDTFLRFVDDIINSDEDWKRERFTAQYDREATQTCASGPVNIEIEQQTHAETVSALQLAATSISSSIERSIPQSVYVVFQYQPKTKELVSVYMSGALSELTGTLRIPFARRLSGWVAANQQTVANSDPGLDLHDGLLLELSLKKALCTPIVSGTILFGVLSIYRLSERPFSAKEVAHAEFVSRALSTKLADSLVDQTTSLS